MHQINVALALIGATVLLLGLCSDWLKRHPLAEPMLATGVGVGVGPIGLDLLRMASWSDAYTILEQAARLTLAVSLMGVALRLGHDNLKAVWRPVALLLTLGMLAMWLVSSATAGWLLGTSLWTALLVGAVVTPTDPVVASAIVTGEFAEREIEEPLRDSISLDSGANDGLAYLFVLLPVLMLTHESGIAWSKWASETILLGVLLATLVGLALGFATATVLRWVERHELIGKHSLLTTTIALSLTTLGLAQLLDADALISVFIAGLSFNLLVDRGTERAEENVQEAISKLFTRPIFVLFGIMLPWDAWEQAPLQFASFALALLLLRRPLALTLLAPLLRRRYRPADIAFIGWFGPVGVAAIYYATFSLRETGAEIAWHAASAAILASIIAHGVTAAPLTRLRAHVIRRSGAE